jgi:DNA-binding transcriptional MerR regulator
VKNQFLIGELAALFQISTDTLRYYDRINLIKPDVVGENGYRYYSLRSFFKLSRILFLKDLDIPLDEVKGYMDDKNTEKLVKMLHQKQVDLDLKIQSCLNLKTKIQQKLDLLESSKSNSEQIFIKQLPTRHAIYMASADFRAEREIEETLKTYSHYLKFSSWLTEGQIYTSVCEEHLRQRDFHHYQYIFEIPYVESSDLNGASPLTTIEASNYACMLFVGPYSDIDRHYDTLLDWIVANDYEVCGHSIEMNIVDYDFSDSDAEFVSELQIPIIRRSHV